MVLRWRGAKNIGIYGVCLFREREKSRNHRLFDAFWGFAKTVGLTILVGLQKVPTTKITTTTTTGPSSNNYNNNNNDDDDAADDDEDDDNNDNDGNDDSYLVQMKSPSLFPSLYIYIYVDAVPSASCPYPWVNCRHIYGHKGTTGWARQGSRGDWVLPILVAEPG